MAANAIYLSYLYMKVPSFTPGGFARGGTVFRGLQPSEARLHRGSAGAKRGRAKVIGRSPLQKNSKRFHQKAQGNHLVFTFFKPINNFLKIILEFQRPPAERSEARLRPSEERSEAPTERSEAVPPSEARPSRRAKRGRAKVIGRSPLQTKNSKRFHQKAQGNHLF